MKTKKLLKALGVVLAAVALVVVSVLGTMAWLTSTSDKVVNTITVGKVQISLSETNANGDETPLTNSYAVVPGVPTDKDPKVTVAQGSAKAYVRVIVEVDNASKWGTAFPAAVNVNAEEWKLVDNNPTASGDKLTYEYRYIGGDKGIVDAASADKELQLFTKITAPSTWNSDVCDAINQAGGTKVTIQAHAIQADGFADDADMEAVGAKSAADKAWAEFKTQNP